MKYSTSTLSYNVEIKIAASIYILLLIKYPRPLLSPHFTLAHELCQVFRCATFYFKLMCDLQPFVIQPCKPKQMGKKNQQREKASRKPHGLKPRGWCPTLHCVLIIKLSYWPLYTSPSSKLMAGSVPSFLVCCLVLNLSCWEFMNRAAVLFTLN